MYYWNVVAMAEFRQGVVVDGSPQFMMSTSVANRALIIIFTSKPPGFTFLEGITQKYAVLPV